MTARCALARHIGAAIVALVLGVTGARGAAAAAESAYPALWVEAGAALAGFADAPLVQGRGARPNPAALFATWRREEGRLAQALATLSASLPPAEAAAVHWRLLPLYEQALAAMTMIRAAGEAGDAAAGRAGWAAFRDALALLRRGVTEIGHGGP